MDFTSSLINAAGGPIGGGGDFAFDAPPAPAAADVGFDAFANPAGAGDIFQDAILDNATPDFPVVTGQTFEAARVPSGGGSSGGFLARNRLLVAAAAGIAASAVAAQTRKRRAGKAGGGDMATIAGAGMGGFVAAYLAIGFL